MSNQINLSVVASLNNSARDHCLFYAKLGSMQPSVTIIIAISSLPHLSRRSNLLATIYIEPYKLIDNMASTMSGTSFTSSTSFRASQSHPPSYSYTDNPLTQLPSVDFNFEDLRQRMAAFTVKFDAFIEKGRKRVLEERNEFRGRLGELGGMYASFHLPAVAILGLFIWQEEKAGLGRTREAATIRPSPISETGDPTWINRTAPQWHCII